MFLVCACTANKNPAFLLGLHLLCSKNHLLCLLALLQFYVHYAQFYATLQSIMLLILHNLMNISTKLIVYEPPVTLAYRINSTMPYASEIKALNKY